MPSSFPPILPVSSASKSSNRNRVMGEERKEVRREESCTKSKKKKRMTEPRNKKCTKVRTSDWNATKAALLLDGAEISNRGGRWAHHRVHDKALLVFLKAYQAKGRKGKEREGEERRGKERKGEGRRGKKRKNIRGTGYGERKIKRCK